MVPESIHRGLLDVLDKYNVKVTFFVTNTHPDYQNLIAEEAKRGHTVAIHSASHKYNQIYTSEQAFFDDLEQMNSIIKAQTGNDASIIRFPGGSSNTVSKDYCPGIMTQLVNDVTARGLLYCDWNVSSGDANNKPISIGTGSAECHFRSTEPQRISCIAARHKGFQCKCGRADHPVGTGETGYTFLPLTTSSPMSHHRVNKLKAPK
jgi:peptidoglycan/xylan/chitin deacetylase (PgdA/CDA1 family)